MLDPRCVRTDIETTAQRLKRRGFSLNSALLTQLESHRKEIQIATQALQNQRNQNAKAIGIAKGKGENIEPLLAQVADLGEQLKHHEEQLTEIQTQLNQILFSIPNMPHESVPEGTSEEHNVEIRRYGKPPEFNFQAKEHFDLGDTLGLFDFPLSVKLAGARFVVMRGDLVRLHRALIQFMIDIHTREHGYEEIYVPYLVNEACLFGTGQLPKMADDVFKIQGDPGYYLVPTAEVPVTNTIRDEILDPATLPIQYVCHTPCFRAEAGTYGRDTRGMIRQHQFEKVELVWIVKPEESYQTLEKLIGHAETILQRLELPYRVMSLCAGDMGFSAAKTYDLEVWLPGQGQYREISSCSNCEDFQARRLQGRYRHPETGKPELLHTLNGSGLAIGRTLIAIMENYQDSDGNIHIPKALQSYMGGMTQLKRRGE